MSARLDRCLIAFLGVLAGALGAQAGTWSRNDIAPYAANSSYDYRATYEWTSIDDSTNTLNATRCGTVIFAYSDDVEGTDTAAAATVKRCENGGESIGTCITELTLTADAPFLPVFTRPGYFHVDVTAAPGTGTARVSASCSPDIARSDAGDLSGGATAQIQGTATGGGIQGVINSDSGFVAAGGFAGAGVQPGDKVLNTTDSVVAWVLQVGVGSITTSIFSNSGSMGAGDTYVIRMGGARTRLGALHFQRLNAIDQALLAGECLNFTAESVWSACPVRHPSNTIGISKRSVLTSYSLMPAWVTVPTVISGDYWIKLYHLNFTGGSEVYKIHFGGLALNTVGEMIIGNAATGMPMFLLEPGDAWSLIVETPNPNTQCEAGAGCVLSNGTIGAHFVGDVEWRDLGI